MHVNIGSVQFGGGKLGWILGPCALESQTIALTVANVLVELAQQHNMGIVFKGSFDKANRTSGSGQRGPGIDHGLAILEQVKVQTGLPVITDVHETSQISAVAAVVDAIQIPAFLCRQTDLIIAAAKTGKPVLIKKGQFASSDTMKHAVEKAGKQNIMVAERGNSFGYHDLVVDFRNLIAMRAFAPVIFDATHSLQHPSLPQGQSGGDRRYLEGLCRAAMAVGVDGLFLETHPKPEEAISDQATQLPLSLLPGLVRQFITLQENLSR